MRSLILCEGFDDVLILGYYLHKMKGWNFAPKAVFSELYNFPKLNAKRQIIEIYTKENNFIGIWAVGGKDAFGTAYKFIHKINNQFPEEGINKVFLVMDKDDGEMESTLLALKKKMNQNGLNVLELHNNKKNSYQYEVEGETFHLDIIPIIVPFDKNGALETVLLDGIAETGSEEKYVVECADEYVEQLVNSGELHKYLQHTRLILKAKLSAAISITNPDRSTALFNEVLMSWNWEEKEAVQRHFGNIIKYLEE